MKHLITTTILFAAPALAHADPWTSSDTHRELGFQALYAFDLEQNLTALKYWQHRKTADLSPLISKNPYMGYSADERAITNYFVMTGLVHWAVSAMLPEEYRPVWQWVSIGYVASDIGINYQLGFKVRF